jgi:hypothetical protein
MTPALSTCPECGGNCEPECGQHPKGCLFNGIITGEWAIHPTCKLPHRNVSRAIAESLLASLRLNIRIIKNP